MLNWFSSEHNVQAGDAGSLCVSFMASVLSANHLAPVLLSYNSSFDYWRQSIKQLWRFRKRNKIWN